MVVDFYVINFFMLIGLVDYLVGELEYFLFQILQFFDF